MPPTPRNPPWFWSLLGVPERLEGESFEIGGERYLVRGGLPRSEKLHSATQAQTSDAFGFKWHKRDTFESDQGRARMREWLYERYGHVTEQSWFSEHGEAPIVLDAGCGAALSAIELFGEALRKVRYVGVDVSTAVEVAAARFQERGYPGAFIQADLGVLPFRPGSVDLVFSEGVLHHTDSTRVALHSVASLLKPSGRILFYVYRTKGPVREFSDEYVRAKMQRMSPEDGWNAMLPLTKLGIALGQLNAEIDIPEPIALLDIPAGRINVQRLFYWHVLKAFYREDHTVEELNHINFDWFAPANAHRQTPEEVREWCRADGLTIEREILQEAGITIIARKG